MTTPDDLTIDGLSHAALSSQREDREEIRVLISRAELAEARENGLRAALDLQMDHQHEAMNALGALGHETVVDAAVRVRGELDALRAQMTPQPPTDDDRIAAAVCAALYARAELAEMEVRARTEAAARERERAERAEGQVAHMMYDLEEARRERDVLSAQRVRDLEEARNNEIASARAVRTACSLSDAQSVEIRALCEEVERLKRALAAVAAWRGVHETPIALFERVAADFYADSGMLAPGKSYATAQHPPPDDERRAAWNAWITRKNRDLDDQIREALSLPGCVYCDGVAPEPCAKCGAGEEAGWGLRPHVPSPAWGRDPETFARERRGETMTNDKTPGQIAFEAFRAACMPNAGDADSVTEAWEIAARAAYCASAATMGVDSWLVGAKSAADASAARAFALGVESCKALALKACEPSERLSYDDATREIISGDIAAITPEACGWVDVP